MHAARVHSRRWPNVRALRRGQRRGSIRVLRLRLFPHLVDVDGLSGLIHPVRVERGGGSVAQRACLHAASLLDGLDLVEDGAFLAFQCVGPFHLVAEREFAIDLVSAVERVFDDGMRGGSLAFPPVVRDEEPKVESRQEFKEVIRLFSAPVLIELQEVLVLLVVVHDHVDLLVVLGEGVVAADVAAVAARQQRASRARLDPVPQHEVVGPRAVLEGLPRPRYLPGGHLALVLQARVRGHDGCQGVRLLVIPHDLPRLARYPIRLLLRGGLLLLRRGRLGRGFDAHDVFYVRHGDRLGPRFRPRRVFTRSITPAKGFGLDARSRSRGTGPIGRVAVDRDYDLAIRLVRINPLGI